MDTLTQILLTLGRADFFDLANAPVNEADYLLASILPEQRRGTYTATNGRVKVITTMAGETGMDSPYAPVGSMELTAEQKPIAKFTAFSVLGEKDQRDLVEMVNQIRLGNVPGNVQNYSRDFLLNWLRKVIAQSFTDRNEAMRGEALTTGQLVLRGGTVDLSVPNENKTSFTGADGFGGASSKFWSAIRAADRTVKGTRARIMNFDTLDMILDNTANNIVVTSDNTDSNGLIRRVGIRRLSSNSNATGFSPDVRDSTVLIGYDRRVNIKNPAGGEITKLVIPDGKIIVAGQNTVDTLDQNGTIVQRPGLGETHIGPTVEGDGQPGIFLNSYTPQGRAWQVVAEGAENALTIFGAPEKLAIVTTEVA